MSQIDATNEIPRHVSFPLSRILRVENYSIPIDFKLDVLNSPIMWLVCKPSVENVCII